jgi:hypothetical protein
LMSRGRCSRQLLRAEGILRAPSRVTVANATPNV